MTTFVPRVLSDRLTLGWISVFIACTAGCQSELADPQSGSSSTAPGQSMGGGKSSSDSANSGGDDEQGGADGATKSSSQGGGPATSDSGAPSGGADDKPDSGGSSAVNTERAGSSSAQGGTSSSTTTRGDAAKGGAGSASQGGTATGGRSSRNSASGGRTQFGSATGGRAFGGQATGGKSQASATGGKAQGGTAATGGSNRGGSNTGGSNTTNASTAPSSDAQEYVDATNAVRAAVTAPSNYSGTWVPLPNVTWSEEVAASAQKWANHLRDAENCGLVHEQNTGLGENLAMGTRLAPAEAVNMWASEKSKFTYSSPFSYTAAAGHYTQLVWRTSIEIGCASATCGNSVVISCRYKPPGNVIGGKIY
ncbi:MAG TPA: CAP domain-containing protein [Polyangiaceae bacterium]|nr:CAP domain-containing protein [Polyangiaceae bacterium]